MLNLWRKPLDGQNRIVIVPPSGGKITVTVVGIQGGRVKVAVDAPADWSIDREEVFEAYQRERASRQVGR
jgi:carbon storage regulator CsrA